MKVEKKVKKLVTHDGSFHTDDIFACATLSLMLEANNEPFEIIRTRDEDIIKSGDYVFDVGGIYDEKNNRFDHHQTGGAGKRPARNASGIADARPHDSRQRVGQAGGENGIAYSSFGLVWHKFGAQITGNQKVADLIDTKLVAPVDANDNGIDLFKNNFPNILPYTLQDVFATFSATALEDMEKDGQFTKALAWAKEILKREIKKASDQVEITKIIRGFYEQAKDKRLIVIDAPRVSRYEIWNALHDFPEPLFAVYGYDGDWSAVAMRKEENSFGNRKNFPKSWAGLKAKELQNITGVDDAVFCHNNLFLIIAKSKEGAIELAKKALVD
ncbi:MAG: MYG1 family protein [Candidatus Paceibacterota bacterium]